MLTFNLTLADNQDLELSINKYEFNFEVQSVFDVQLLTKLNGIETGAQVNDIEVIKVNGVAQTVTSKTVDITVSSEVPLIFSNGVTRTANEIKNDLITGKAGGQTIIGGTQVGDALIVKATTGIGTTTGIGYQVKVGDNGAINAITVLNNGNVGYGTVNPAAPIHISTLLSSTYTNPAFLIEGLGAFTDLRIHAGTNALNSMCRVVLSTNIDAQIGYLIGQNNTVTLGNSQLSVAGRAVGIHTSEGAPLVFHTTENVFGSGNPTMILTKDLRVGINTTTPSYPFAFGGNSEVTIGLERNTVPNTAGVDGSLILSGGTTSGATNKSAGVAILKTGLATGTGYGYYSVQTSPRLSTGTSDNTLVEQLRIGDTARLTLLAGSAVANTAPLKFTSGVLNTTAEAGALEYNNTPHFTNADAVRRNIVLSDGTYTAGLVEVGGKVKIKIGGTEYNVLVEYNVLE